VKIAGKEFPETPTGYRAAAEHLFTYSPVYEQDGYELLREARRMERGERLERNIRIAAAILAGGLLIWQLFR
jgi:hypothetical protein